MCLFLVWNLGVSPCVPVWRVLESAQFMSWMMKFRPFTRGAVDQLKNHPNCSVDFAPICLNADGGLEVSVDSVDLVVACLRNDELQVLTAIAHFAHKRGLPWPLWTR